MNSSTENNEACPSCEFDENLSILREIYFFSELPLETLKVIAYLCTRENFKKGDYLFHQNDDDGHAFYIISGKSGLGHDDGNKSFEIREFEKGAFVGSMALLGTARRLFSLQALTDMTCLVLTREKFIKAMEQFPDIMPRILKAVVGSIHAWEQSFLNEIDPSCEACMHKIGVSLV